MTKQELCEMCEEYSSDTSCESEEDCKLLALLKENEKLKKENSSLKKEVSKLKNEMSYMVNPCAIGDRHEMGW